MLEMRVAMFVIRNKKTGKWVYGTDHRYNPHHQRTSDKRALTFEDLDEAKHQFKMRQCGKDYEVVKVRLVEEAE